MNLYWPKRSKFRSERAKNRRFVNRMKRAEAAANQVLTISHGGCLDGVGAVIMTMRKYGEAHVGVMYCQPSDMKRVLEYYAEEPGNGRRLQITDLSINPDQYKSVVSACKRMRDHGWHIEWRDHHHKQWEGVDLKKLRAVIHTLEVSPNKESGASMQQKALLKSDTFAQKLATVIRDRDLWLNETEDGELLEFAITDMGTDKFTQHMLAKDGRNRVVDEVILQAADRERQRTESAAKKLLNGTRYFDTKDGKKVGIVYGWLPKNVGLHRVLEKDDVMVAVNVRPNGHMSLRSRQDAPVCQLVCRQFDGGGHPNASGGTLGLKGAAFWRFVLHRGRVGRVDEVGRAAVKELEKS